jgi:uncharacterized protein YecE (DUF72 family)
MVRVGTSGYNYAAWRGTFYPERIPAQAMLAYYAGRFPTVEINATFYRMPTGKVVAGWAAATPEAFTFALKVPRRITHMRRLRDADEPLRLFVDVARILGPRLGPLLFQLPPNFRKDADRLGDLLFRVPADLRIAFEFRHDSWFAADVYALLAWRDAALCLADTEAGSTPDVATASWGYMRLRDVDYTDAELAAWAGRLGRAAWRDAFVFFRHEETARGPALAERLARRL